jgi:hypothetical protein
MRFVVAMPLDVFAHAIQRLGLIPDAFHGPYRQKALVSAADILQALGSVGELFNVADHASFIGANGQFRELEKD